QASLPVLTKSQDQVLRHQTSSVRRAARVQHCVAQVRGYWRSRLYAPVIISSALPRGTMEMDAQGASLQCEATSARRLRNLRGQLKACFEQYCDCRRFVPELVVIVPPFFVNLVFSGL